MIQYPARVFLAEQAKALIPGIHGAQPGSVVGAGTQGPDAEPAFPAPLLEFAQKKLARHRSRWCCLRDEIVATGTQRPRLPSHQVDSRGCPAALQPPNVARRDVCPPAQLRLRVPPATPS
jgi:hypothetical protein